MESCLEEILTDIDMDVSEFYEYLQTGTYPDFEELGLSDCLPEDY